MPIKFKPSKYPSKPSAPKKMAIIITKITH